MMLRRCLPLLFCLISLFAVAQERRGSRPAEPQPSGAPAAQPSRTGGEPRKEPGEPVVTHHEIHVGGKTLRYTATTGMMPIHDAEGELDGNMFFIAYTLEGQNPSERRPLTFSFNGGPGSASVWLHMGAIGPKRVKMQPEGMMPAPPYQLVDNEFTWLDQTDLVFIDPVGTGYSRAAKNDLKKKFLGVREDLETVGEFIRLYLGRYERWSSPLFLVGESYGTTRAAGLSGYLLGHGIAFNGIMLISSVMNFETLEFTPGNDLPYILYLPTYATTAWYHKKLGSDLQDFQKLRSEVEQWASTAYAEALAKGDRLTAEERNAVIDRLSRYTGLSKTYLDQANLRVDEPHFTKELLRDQKLVTGRLDSRFTGEDRSLLAETVSYDPSETAIRAPYTAMFNQYVRTELGYKSDTEYYVLGGGFGFTDWNWGSARSGFPETAQALRDAFQRNPYMKLFVGSGYFDLATPYFATQYTLNHMGLYPKDHSRVSLGYYGAGHMMYIRDESLGDLKRDITNFMNNALK